MITPVQKYFYKWKNKIKFYEHQYVHIVRNKMKNKNKKNKLERAKFTTVILRSCPQHCSALTYFWEFWFFKGIRHTLLLIFLIIILLKKKIIITYIIIILFLSSFCMDLINFLCKRFKNLNVVCNFWALSISFCNKGL